MPGRRPAGWAVAAVLLLALVADAAFSATHPATVTPTAAATLPVSLAAIPLTGTTVTAGTAATTTGLVPGVAAVSTLSVARQGTGTWDVVLAVTSAAGITGSETLVLSLVGGATRTVSLAAGTAYPQAAAALTLDGTGLVLAVAKASVLSSCTGCTVQAELRITPSGTSLPSFVYPYTVATA